MIGTHSPARAFAAFIVLSLAAVGLSFVWGCNDLPVSVPGVSSGAAPASNAIPLRDGHKSDVAVTTGAVDEIDYAAMRLRVARLWFRADSGTEVETDTCDSGCVFADIAAGDAVKVKHERRLEPDGTYYAHEIEVENEDEEPDEPEEDQTESEGMVDAVDEGSFQVGGVWFWTDAATAFEWDECAGGTVAVGDDVKVEHLTTDTAGFGFYAFKVEVSRACEEEGEEGRAVIMQ